MSKNKILYIAKYNKENYKMYQFRVKKNELDLIERLDGISDRNAYLLNLIKEDFYPSILTIRQIKERIRPIIEKYNVKDVYLFGSYSRGEANRNSDVDIYCDSGNIKTLFDLSDFSDELEKALGKKVDVVTIGSQMHPHFKEQLEKDMIKIC